MRIEGLLEENRAGLESLVRDEERGLLRFESVDDLVQGVCERVLAKADAFEYEDAAAAKGWLWRVARNFLADRADYWHALRRGGGKVLRLTMTPGNALTDAAGVPAAAQTGPVTFAARREMVLLAAKTLATLPERDRQLVEWTSAGVALAEQAERLGLSHGAAQRAAHRAMTRFRRAFELIDRHEA